MRVYAFKQSSRLSAMPVGCRSSTFSVLEAAVRQNDSAAGGVDDVGHRRAVADADAECANAGQDLVLVPQQLQLIRNSALETIEDLLGDVQRVGFRKRITTRQVVFGPPSLRETNGRVRKQIEISERIGLERRQEHEVDVLGRDAVALEHDLGSFVLGSPDAASLAGNRGPDAVDLAQVVGQAGIEDQRLAEPLHDDHVEIQMVPLVRRARSEDYRTGQLALAHLEGANREHALKPRTLVLAIWRLAFRRRRSGRGLGRGRRTAGKHDRELRRRNSFAQGPPEVTRDWGAGRITRVRGHVGPPDSSLRAIYLTAVNGLGVIAATRPGHSSSLTFVNVRIAPSRTSESNVLAHGLASRDLQSTSTPVSILLITSLDDNYR